MEEADINMSELQKEYYEFERDVLKGALHPQTKKIMAEKCLRFFDDKIKARVSAEHVHSRDISGVIS